MRQKINKSDIYACQIPSQIPSCLQAIHPKKKGRKKIKKKATEP